jgi:hypothetical protein
MRAWHEAAAFRGAKTARTEDGMGPIAIDIRSLLATAWRAIRHAPVSWRATDAASAPSVPAGRREDCSGLQELRIEGLLDHSRLQIDRTRESQQRAQRSIDAVSNALQGLATDIERVLETSRRHRETDPAVMLGALASDAQLVAAHARVPDRAAS